METLDFLFPNVDEEEDAGQPGPDGSSASVASATSSHIVVTTLSGECATLSYNPNKTILDLKKEIEKELKTPCDKQRLLYQNTELKVCTVLLIFMITVQTTHKVVNTLIFSN